MGHFLKWPEKSSISRNGPQKNRKYEAESLNFVIKTCHDDIYYCKRHRIKVFLGPILVLLEISIFDL